MGKETFNIIGIMSGTSLDGLDLAFCRIYRKEDSWDFELLASRSIDYSEEFRSKLKNSVNLSSVELLMLHNEFGTLMGREVRMFIEEDQLRVDFVSSHGHTVFHQPEKGVTLQIGSGQHLANACRLKVICDFRTKDVSLGGQGAPFVPIGDRLFFSEYDFCLNLGGISNISFSKNNTRIAFDISPVNMLLNYVTNKIGKAYDEGGKIAAGGNLDKDLLKTLNALEFYRQPFPKSLGYEWFKEKVLPLVENYSGPVENLLHTCIHHIAAQIAEQVNSAAGKNYTTLLATGGGAKNEFLIEVLQQKLEKTKVIIPATEIIDFKEAVIFALMGALREVGEVNVLSSVTGATADSCSGVVFLPG